MRCVPIRRWLRPISGTRWSDAQPLSVIVREGGASNKRRPKFFARSMVTGCPAFARHDELLDRSAMLTVQNLAAGYGPAQVLFDVSFAVGTGEVVTLLGRNGMGK